MATEARKDDRAKPVWGEPPSAQPTASPAGATSNAQPGPSPGEAAGASPTRGPVEPAGKGPVEPAGKGPAKPAGKGPVEPAGKGPVEPAGKGPVEPAVRTPSKSRGVARVAKRPVARAAKSQPAPADAPPTRRPSPGKRAPAPSRSRRLRARYVVVHETDGPRVRLGFCWFTVAFGALVAGSLFTAVVYGVAAAIAAAQMARCWRRQGARPSEMMAATGAALVAVGACLGAGGAGLGIIACVIAAFAGTAQDADPLRERLVEVGMTLQCSLPAGIVAMSMVLLTRLDTGSAVALLLLASAYETGDYLIGVGATTPYEGPAAGVAAIVVITFIVSTLPISALSFGEAWFFGGLVAVLAPVGQWAASGLLPSAVAPASALRRLDTILITAPAWAWGAGLVLQPN